MHAVLTFGHQSHVGTVMAQQCWLKTQTYLMVSSFLFYGALKTSRATHLRSHVVLSGE